MNLRDTIAGMPDGETLYIGAASSFFWIGEKKDAIEAIERESNAAILMATNKSIPYVVNDIKNALLGKAKAIADINAINNELAYERISEELRSEYVGEIRALRKTVESCECRIIDRNRQYAKLVDYVAQFIPFLERDVIEVYDRRFYEPLGKIIVFRGSENGHYWSADEMVDQ